MFKSVMKAIGIMVLVIIGLLGATVFLGTIWFAWPLLVAIVIFGIPFIIVGVVTGKKNKDK